MKILIRLALLILIYAYSIVASFAQTTGDYRSNATNMDWTTASDWQTWNGSAWVTASTFPGQTGITGAVTIQAGHTVNILINLTAINVESVKINGTLYIRDVVFNLNTNLLIVTGGLTPPANIEFYDRAQIKLPSEAVLFVTCFGLNTSNQGNEKQVIFIGTTPYYNTTNGGGPTFDDVMAASGNGVVAATANPTTICVGQSTILTLTVGGVVVTGTVYWANSCYGPSVGAGNNLLVSPPVGITTYYGWYITGCGEKSLCGEVTVTVSPEPVITNMTTKVCSAVGFTAVPANGANGVVPAGTTYSWAAPDVAGITGAAAGTNAANISGTLTNTTNAAINVVYTVTPTSGGCSGATFSVTVTVNPLPDCSFTGPGPLCPSSIGNIYTAPAGMTTYAWSITGNGTINGALNGPSVNVTAGNCNNPLTNCPFTLTLIVTNLNGCSSTCSQVVAVGDILAPTFTAPGPFEFCVENLISAVFVSNNLEINPDPDYYLFMKGNTIFDLDPAILKNNFNDNCCANNLLEIHWRIDFTDTPNPLAPPPNLTFAPISGNGQPSAYFSDIKLPGDGVNFTPVIHKITYWLVDCNGNKSLEKEVNITIKPRPNIIKTTI